MCFVFAITLIVRTISILYVAYFPGNHFLEMDLRNPPLATTNLVKKIVKSPPYTIILWTMHISYKKFYKIMSTKWLLRKQLHSVNSRTIWIETKGISHANILLQYKAVTRSIITSHWARFVHFYQLFGSLCN